MEKNIKKKRKKIKTPKIKNKSKKCVLPRPQKVNR